jgi:hypothetical protein
LDNILRHKGEPSSYKKFFGGDSLYEEHLRTFGELGVVTENPGAAVKAKLANRGILCMFLGYAKDHAGDVYRMLNLTTRKVIITRDIRWINKNYGEKKGKSSRSFLLELDDEDDSKSIEPSQPQPEAEHTNAPPEEPNQEPPPRLPRELRALQPFNRPGRKELNEDGEGTLFCFVTHENTETDDTPQTFEEAWWHPDEEKRKKWREAIRLEFRQMIKLQVWRRKGLNSIPNGRKGIGMKWVFKEKKNGVFRARLVAKGYDQIAGIDFQYNFAPVTSEITLRTALILWVINAYYAEIADVKTAFLHGDLEEEIFILNPPGYKEFLEELGEVLEGSYLQLSKSCYGLVQAARQFWKKWTGFLKEKLGFEQHPNDSCLLKKQTEKGIIIIIIYVDDCLVLGHEQEVKKILKQVEEVFDITRSKDVEDFIGCNIERDQDMIYLSQPDLIKKLIGKFEDKITNLQDYDTPAPANFRVVRPKDEEMKLSDQEQSLYRSGVGSLLYLLKHSRPDLSNSVRELSKVMDGANQAHLKALYRTIKFVKQTQHLKLKLKPWMNRDTWIMRAFCDSDFAGDLDDRKSISGYVIYICGCPIAWRSKGQKNVTLSSTEAEYVAISEVAQEILFISGILEFMGIKIDYPIIVNVDNIGAIYLAQTATTGNRTKHIDTRYHFVREYIEKGIMKVVFVRSAENDADIFTKNLPTESYLKHQKKVMNGHDVEK